jgi:pimeloyl-ACP methyl ester carboxylesterase
MRVLLLLLVFVVGCNKGGTPKSKDGKNPLLTARSQLKTKLIDRGGDRDPIEVPPKGVFELVKYKAPAGMLGAYLTPDPKDGKKHPAIIWITGGDCNSIGDVWSPAEADNDQTAAAYRQKGIVMMFPSLRGGNQNPGKRESFLGEVDDILAAADHLAKLPYVDPARIYLGGHSTGGTMVLMVAECSDRFRAVFSFGPADRVMGYGPEMLAFNPLDDKEERVRSPQYWLEHITSPTFVFEGNTDGNIDALYTFKKGLENSLVKLYEVRGRNHFSVLAPTNQLIADQILKDTGNEVKMTFPYKQL